MNNDMTYEQAVEIIGDFNQEQYDQLSDLSTNDIRRGWFKTTFYNLDDMSIEEIHQAVKEIKEMEED